MLTCPRYKEEGSRNLWMSRTRLPSRNESAWVSGKQLQKFQPNEISFTLVSVLPSQFFKLFLIFSCSAPVLHAKQPVQLREVTRAKEFPAGNAATSALRIAFLHSLCKLPHFVLLLDLVPSVVCNFLLTMVSQLNYRKYSQSLHQCWETTLPRYHGTVKRFTYLQNSTLRLHSRALYRF